MTFKTDNRWNTGITHDLVPADAPAAYGARWIDTGTSIADVVPDRQGLAYNAVSERDALIEMLMQHTPHTQLLGVKRDSLVELINTGTFVCVVRRSGGYVYADAWLTEIS